MSIHIRDRLSADAYRALQNLALDRDWVEVRAYMEPGEVAWMTFQLEQEPDNEESFPRGKWATIQQLQATLRGYALDAARAKDKP